MQPVTHVVGEGETRTAMALWDLHSTGAPYLVEYA